MRLFDIAVPLLASTVAIFSIPTDQLTKETARAIRQELEQRRGKAA